MPDPPADRKTPPRSRFVLVIAVALVPVVPAGAVDITVGADCDLVEAVFNANFDGSSGSPEPDCAAGDPAGADTIHLTGDVSLPTALPGFPNTALRITSRVHVDGHGFAIERMSSSPRFRLFTVTSAGDLTLEDVIVSRGRSDRGGGIFNNGGVVTIRNSQMRRHRAVGGSTMNRGGAIFNQGGTLTLLDSTLNGNDAVATTDVDALGGAVYTDGEGSVSITNSSLFSNTATDGASSKGDGGAIAIEGGELTVTNSTLSGNLAGATGGALLASTGTTLIYDSTIFGNTPGNDSIQARPLPTLPPTCIERVSLLNTIIDPAETGCGCTITEDSGTFGCSVAVTNVDPTLSDNGGPSSTHALLVGSNAIDAAGDCAAIDPILALDQRGAPRFDGSCDSGAFEFGGCPILGLDEPVALPDSYEECEIRLGAAFRVMGSGGLLTLTAGSQVTFDNGVQIDLVADDSFIVAIDPDLQVSSAIEEATTAGFEMPN